MHTRLAPLPTRNDTAPQHPFTHHQILELVGPFARAGRHVDLENSDRLRRILVFKSVVPACEKPDLAGLAETLRLENPRAGYFRLTRHLAMPNGLHASLTAEGTDPGDLLGQLQCLPPDAQFQSHAATLIAMSYHIEPASNDPARGAASPRVLFTRGDAHVGGLRITLNEALVKGCPADISIAPLEGGRIELPEDLLAVLGWEWGLLRRQPLGWSAGVRVHGTGADRFAAFQAKLQAMITHVSATLAQPPAQFHEKLRRARWGVTGRRAIPLLFWTALIAGAASLRFVAIPPDSIVRLLLIATPSVLMVGAFGMRDRPPFEIPPLPRRLNEAAW